MRTAAIRDFLARKWAGELDYRLINELWAFTGDRIAVRFAHEWHDDSGNRFRSYGLSAELDQPVCLIRVSLGSWCRRN